MLSAVHHPSIHYPSMEQTSAMINYLMEAIVSFQTGYDVCCSKHLIIHSLCLVFCLSQTLTEPAIFARESGCDCQAPHEKLTMVQARRGTPGAAPSFHHPPAPSSTTLSSTFTSASVFMMKRQFLMYTAASITIYSS